MIPLRKYWIRKDRERYFLIGVIVNCVIASFVSSYWHFSDRITAPPNIRLHAQDISRKLESKKLKEAQFYEPRFKADATQYYRIERDVARPKIPVLPEVGHAP